MTEKCKRKIPYYTQGDAEAACESMKKLTRGKPAKVEPATEG